MHKHIKQTAGELCKRELLTVTRQILKHLRGSEPPTTVQQRW